MWTDLTIENAFENAPIISKSNPEWGEKRLRWEGGFWIHWSARGSAVLHTGEFRFWSIKVGA